MKGASKHIVNIFALIAFCIILSACGISSSKQEHMQMSLENSLSEAFLNQDNFVAFIPKVSLRNLEKGGAFKYEDAAYHGSFSCSFKNLDKDSEVVIRGTAIFDKKGNLIKDSDGKYGIYVIMITENNKEMDLNSCIYKIKEFN